MSRYVISAKNGSGDITDENENVLEFPSAEAAEDWAIKNEVSENDFDITELTLTPEEQANIRNLRESALKEQADYQNLSKAVDNDWYHLGSDAFLGKWVPNDNQGFWGKAYDAGSYPLRLALGGYEGLAKSIYSGLESGAQGVQRVAEGKDLNFLEKEATNPINAAAAIGSPFASKLVVSGGKYALKFLPALASLIEKGAKWPWTVAAGREALAQGGLLAPVQTGLENLKRWSKGEGEEMLGLAPMMGYGALGGAAGEFGANLLKKLGKKAFSSEVKVRPSVQSDAANAPDVDFLFDAPKEYFGKQTGGLRNFINAGRRSGYTKDGKFIETTSELVPFGDTEDLLNKISNFADDWLERRNEFATGTDAVVNLRSIFDATVKEIQESTELGDAEKVKALARLRQEWQDALRTYHKMRPTIVDKKAPDDVYPTSKAQRNYPVDLSIPSDVMDVAETTNPENIPIFKFKDILDLRKRAGENANFDKYQNPKTKNIETSLYRALYKHINKSITEPAKSYGIKVPSKITTSTGTYEVKNPKAVEDMINAGIDPQYMLTHNLSGKDLEDFLKTQDVLKHTTPWELELPRTIARTTNKNLMGLPEIIGGGATGIGGAIAGNALIDEDDSEAQKLAKIIAGGVVGGGLGVGGVKSTMRGLGPARVMYEAGKSLSKEAAPALTAQQLEKDKKAKKTEAKRAQMLTKGGSSAIQVVPVYNQYSSVESMPR